MIPAAANREKKPIKVKILCTFDLRFSLLTMRANVAISKDVRPTPPKINGDNSISCSILSKV